jgi:hypothetical protein
MQVEDIGVAYAAAEAPVITSRPRHTRATAVEREEATPCPRREYARGAPGAARALAGAPAWQSACSPAAMTIRRTLMLALSIALFIAAGWTSGVPDPRPRSFSLLLLGVSLVAGASSLPRRRVAQ